MTPKKPKRGYSREFRKRTDRRVDIVLSWVPPTLKAEALAKSKREGVSLRNTILRWLKNWSEGRKPDEDAPARGEVRGSTRALPLTSGGETAAAE